MSQQTKVLVFARWDPDEVTVEDAGLKNVISLKAMLVPHSFGRHEHERFRKVQVNLLERLANNLMRGGRQGGKKTGALKTVLRALEVVEEKTGANPLKALVKAVENSAPREDTTRVSYGGIAYFHAVDMAPARRVDLALRNIVEGARLAAFHKPRTLSDSLAEQIILAAGRDPKSYAVAKKEELERHAMASR